MMSLYSAFTAADTTDTLAAGNIMVKMSLPIALQASVLLMCIFKYIFIFHYILDGRVWTQKGRKDSKFQQTMRARDGAQRKRLQLLNEQPRHCKTGHTNA